MRRFASSLLILCAAGIFCTAQQKTYTNPVLHADFSDPDVVEVDGEYYMTASSFGCAPGLPVLHSRDLVNWNMLSYALPELTPIEEFETPQHGKAVWAPCIRHHEGEFYIYWGDPDRGIFCVKSPDAIKWEQPILVKAGKGMIDATPLWDDDGKVYLAHAWAASRAGMNSIISLFELDSTGTRAISDPVIVFDGNDGVNYTVEGPKLYKRGGEYYIFAPAGGVAVGWQLVMRSRDIFGPYETRRVMEQGSTDINGPHQGAWVSAGGEDWFLHFQDKDAYGRVVHLNPLKWQDGWPVIGIDKDGDGCGEPVYKYKYPDTKLGRSDAPNFDDEFDNHRLGLWWQWQTNYKNTFGMPTNQGTFRLYAHHQREDENSWNVPNLLLQKFMYEEFTATTKVKLTTKFNGQQAGFMVMGLDYFKIGAEMHDGTYDLVFTRCIDAEHGKAEERQVLASVDPSSFYNNGRLDNSELEIYFRIEVKKGAKCQFYYSLDGKKFVKAGSEFAAKEGKWIGAKLGYFATTPLPNDKGWMDIDWFRVKEN